MAVKTALATLASALITTMAWAEETDGWINITSTAQSAWHGKKGSGYISNLDGKKNSAYAYVYQRKDMPSNKFEYGKIVIALDACKRGYGYVYYNNMENAYTGKNAFVRFGPTVADSLGTMACTSWDNATGRVSKQDNGDTWEEVAKAKSSGDEYSLKKDTIRKRDYKGKSAVSGLLMFHKVSNNTYTYSENIVTLHDCKAGYGTLHEIDLSATFIGKSDFALDGSSVGAAIADALCRYKK